MTITKRDNDEHELWFEVYESESVLWPSLHAQESTNHSQMAPIPVEALQHHACGYTTTVNLPSILLPFRSDPAVRLLMVYRASLGSYFPSHLVYWCTIHYHSQKCNCLKYCGDRSNYLLQLLMVCLSSSYCSRKHFVLMLALPQETLQQK